MTADTPDQLVEVGMQKRFTAAEGDDLCSQSGEKIDAAQHLGCRHVNRDFVVLVAIRASKVAAPDRNDMGEDGMIA